MSKGDTNRTQDHKRYRNSPLWDNLKTEARWIRCDDCDDFWCTLHQAHVYDCECASLEDLLESGIDPYGEPVPA